jgi:hypothetical protein
MISLEKREFGDDSSDSLARLAEMFLGSKAAHSTMISPGQHLQPWACIDRHRKPKELARNAKKPGKTFGF